MRGYLGGVGDRDEELVLATRVPGQPLLCAFCFVRISFLSLCTDGTHIGHRESAHHRPHDVLPRLHVTEAEAPVRAEGCSRSSIVEINICVEGKVGCVWVQRDCKVGRETARLNGSASSAFRATGDFSTADNRSLVTSQA